MHGSAVTRRVARLLARLRHVFLRVFDAFSCASSTRRSPAAEAPIADQQYPEDCMGLVLTSAPALEPVTVDEAKAHLRVVGAAEDTLIASLILTSRLHVETALGLALITQGWRLTLDKWPEGRDVELPLRPLQGVEEVRVVGVDGDATIVAASKYLVDVASSAPRLIRRTALPVPDQAAAGIEIDFVGGFGDAVDDVPAPIRQALLLLVAHWYEHRDPIEIGSADIAIPAAVSQLLQPYRMVRL
jgi:uncharacterized phiE125 gp8 family phage protein